MGLIFPICKMGHFPSFTYQAPENMDTQFSKSSEDPGLFNNFYSFIYLFILLFLAALGLHCCTRALSSCGERGLLFVAVHGLLVAVASLVLEHRL